MAQITGIPRAHDEGTSAWRFAHECLSQLLLERVEPFSALIPIIKLDGAGTCIKGFPYHRHIEVPEEVERA